MAPRLPALAHRVGSHNIDTVPTPEHMIHGHHPLKTHHHRDFHRGIAGHGHEDNEPYHYEHQIYGKVLPQGGYTGQSHRGHRQKFQIYGMVLPRSGFVGRDVKTALAMAGAAKKKAKKTRGGGMKFDDFSSSRTQRRNMSLAAKRRRVAMRKKMGFSGKAHTVTGRLGLAGSAHTLSGRLGLAGRKHTMTGRLGLAGFGFSGADAPPSYPDYPGNAQRTAIMRRAQRALAGADRPPSYPDYPGNAQRAGFAGGLDSECMRCAHGDPRHHHHEHDHGHGDDEPCCESCATGGPCEGCDGAGGCGKPNCGCMK